MQNEQATVNKSANSLYREYKKSGGTLSFADYIEREKTKGVFPLNVQLNEEVQTSINEFKSKNMLNKKVLGLPVKTLLIAGAIIVIAVAVVKLKKK